MLNSHVIYMLRGSPVLIIKMTTNPSANWEIIRYINCKDNKRGMAQIKWKFQAQ